MKLLISLLSVVLLYGCSTVEAKDEKKLVSYIINPKDEVLIELGTKELKIRDFFEGSQSYFLIDERGSIEFNSEELTKPGNTTVKLLFSDFMAYEGVETFELEVNVKVQDTTAPSLKLKNIEATEGDSVTLESFIESVTDIQKVTTAFKDSYDLTSIGERKVIVVATDESGNKTEQEATLKINEKYVAPVYNPPANNWGGNSGNYNPPVNNNNGGGFTPQAPVLSGTVTHASFEACMQAGRELTKNGGAGDCVEVIDLNTEEFYGWQLTISAR